VILSAVTTFFVGMITARSISNEYADFEEILAGNIENDPPLIFPKIFISHNPKLTNIKKE